jgi:outer membrane protein assembly factor BamB
VLSSLVALVPAASVLADDEDVPKRQPALAWEREVACDGAAELAAPTSASPRRCDIAVASGAVFLHEHSAEGDATRRFRLSRFDITTGDEQWSHDVGPSAEITAYDDLVVLNDKTHFEVYDAATGELRFTRPGAVAAVNRYGTLVLSDGATVTALDPLNGNELWAMEGALGAWCRDIVIVVAAASDDTGTQPFVVVDHFTGEERWTSDEPFDPSRDSITCGFGPFVYTADGSSVREWDAYSGWINWSASVPGADDIELYREVALVRSGEAAGTTVAVERETGEVRWERPAAEVGTAVSIIGRVREDTTGVFTLHPLTGEIVHHTSPEPGLSFEIVASSDTRVVVASGSVVTAYGMNDLGTSWQLDVGGLPDEFGVSVGFLVVRSGAVLRGYG